MESLPLPFYSPPARGGGRARARSSTRANYAFELAAPNEDVLVGWPEAPATNGETPWFQADEGRPMGTQDSGARGRAGSGCGKASGRAGMLHGDVEPEGNSQVGGPSARARVCERGRGRGDKIHVDRLVSLSNLTASEAVNGPDQRPSHDTGARLLRCSPVSVGTTVEQPGSPAWAPTRTPAWAPRAPVHQPGAAPTMTLTRGSFSYSSGEEYQGEWKEGEGAPPHRLPPPGHLTIT